MISISPLLGQLGPNIQTGQPESAKTIQSPGRLCPCRLTSRPYATRGIWHVCDVGDEQSVCPALLRRDSNTLSTLRRGAERRAVINAHICWGATMLRDEACRLSIGLGQILNETMGGVRRLPSNQFCNRSQREVWGLLHSRSSSH